jgi:hypothetical protein
MISASSRACVSSGETTMWTTELKNAITEDQPIRSRLSCQRGWSFRQGQVMFEQVQSLALEMAMQ